METRFFSRCQKLAKMVQEKKNRMTCLRWHLRQVKKEELVIFFSSFQGEEELEDVEDAKVSLLHNNSSNPPSFELSFQNLGFKVYSDEYILSGVTGSLCPGELCAIIGSSGSGKSTLLAAASGRSAGGTVTGKILVNGELDSLVRHKFVTGFVPQDDIMMRELTVQQTIEFAAHVRLDRSIGSREVDSRIEQTIFALVSYYYYFCVVLHVLSVCLGSAKCSPSTNRRCYSRHIHNRHIRWTAKACKSRDGACCRSLHTSVRRAHKWVRLSVIA